ncbi:MAG: hypothetical protein Q8N47_27905 [Bryobacterales bacterium]|nr:hypothetical protein [Bryobacterales bacterium]
MRGVPLSALGKALVFAATPGAVLAQFALGPTQTRFRAVAGWEGSFSLVVNQSGTTPSLFGPATYAVNRKIEGKVKLDKLLPLSGGWTGHVVEGVVSINDKYTLPWALGLCTSVNEVKGTGSLAIGGATGQPEQVFLTFDRGADTWSLVLRENAIKADWTNTLKCPGIPDQVAVNPQAATQWHAQIGPMGLPFPASVFQLIGKQVVDGQGDRNGGMDVVLKADLTYDLKPTLVELVIEPENYDTWRPEALWDEETPASPIRVKAKLQNADGTPVAEAGKAKRIVFELVNVSHEPGIAGNMPRRDPKKTADLKFVAEENTHLEISGDEGNVGRTPDGRYQESYVVVSSFDWGAWGWLKVTAEMEGGATIEGYLKGDRNHKPVRLPQRAANSFIPDSWKRGKGAEKADSDDGEKEPKGLENCDGDGLTLYEEYRGFIENNEHIEGNPLKKDLFVRNMGGAALEPGIWLFGDLTNLEVHSGFAADELNLRERIMNVNYARAPRRVDQHGVVVAICKDVDGGLTILRRGTIRGRPGTTDVVCVQPPGRSGSLTDQFRLALSDVLFAYDKGVAHELLHATGVEHHGNTDKSRTVRFVPSDDPANTTGTPHYEVSGQRATILDEASGRDLAAERDGLYAQLVAEGLRQAEAMRAAGAIRDDVAEFLRLLVRPRYYGAQEKTFGFPGGEHSGDDDCVMRYHFATYYPVRGQANSYYEVPAGTEPLGFGLCELAAGSGVNGSAHRPQPRYWDATPGRGRCRWWVCVNDAVPPGGGP